MPTTMPTLFFFAILIQTSTTPNMQDVERMSLNGYRSMISAAERAYDAKHYDEALPLLKRAACAGDPLSQEVLARMYVLGQGTKQDVTLGYAWAATARDSQLPQARTMVSQLEKALTPTQVQMVQEHAKPYEQSYGVKATNMACLKSDSRGGRIADNVTCTPQIQGGNDVVIKKCGSEN